MLLDQTDFESKIVKLCVKDSTDVSILEGPVRDKILKAHRHDFIYDHEECKMLDF
jgi:hypothetical protein